MQCLCSEHSACAAEILRLWSRMHRLCIRKQCLCSKYKVCVVGMQCLRRKLRKLREFPSQATFARGGAPKAPCSDVVAVGSYGANTNPTPVSRRSHNEKGNSSRVAQRLFVLQSTMFYAPFESTCLICRCFATCLNDLLANML